MPALLFFHSKKPPTRTALRKSAGQREAPKISGVLIGRVAALNDAGDALVDFSGNPTGTPRKAKSILALTKNAVGRPAVLLFEEDDLRRPVIMGLVDDPSAARRPPVDLILNKKKIVFKADEEITLTCGHASITLTASGKIVIRGAYLLSRSSGVNRIKGGSVQIN